MTKIVSVVSAFLAACLAIAVIFSGLPSTVNATASVAGNYNSYQRIPTVNDPEVNYHQDGTPNFNDDPEQMILARAIFGEARGESKKGKIGVGWVIRNRADNPGWWGNSYHTVILKELRGIYQFSALDPTDANYRSVIDPFHTSSPSDKKAWHESYEIPGQILNGKVVDPTKGADHFFSTDIPIPSWADKEDFTVQIGKHKFYRLQLSAPVVTPQPEEEPTQNAILERIEGYIGKFGGMLNTIYGKIEENMSPVISTAGESVILFLGYALTGLIAFFLVRFVAHVFLHSGSILLKALSVVTPIFMLVVLYYLYDEGGTIGICGGVLGVIVGFFFIAKR